MMNIKCRVELFACCDEWCLLCVPLPVSFVGGSPFAVMTLTWCELAHNHDK